MVRISDTFNRADSTTTLGTTNTGETWTVLKDTNLGLFSVWGIQSNKAYDATPLATGQDIAYVEANLADVTITVTVSTIDAGSDVGLAFRIVDFANYYLFICDNTAPEIAVYKNVANSFTQLATFAGSIASNDVLSLEVEGSKITTKQNGIIRNILTDSTHNGTKHGMRQFGSATIGRFDDFSITENAHCVVTLLGTTL